VSRYQGRLEDETMRLEKRSRLQAIFFSCCTFSETGVLITSPGLESKTPVWRQLFFPFNDN
jgi:hypothetical protein